MKQITSAAHLTDIFKNFGDNIKLSMALGRNTITTISPAELMALPVLDISDLIQAQRLYYKI